MNVLSRLIDRAVVEGKLGYHPKCKNLSLTHLCFAYDLMVFVDGNKKSIEEILRVFDKFDAMTGLKISMEKSTLFLAGVSMQKQEDIKKYFPFASGNLPVRYLGLPLLTKCMTVLDFMPLIEKIKKKIGNWTSRFLSYAGRLQLIKSVITNLANFWMAAFRLPSDCLKEIEKLCSAFLWSGPKLNGRKVKIAWSDICRTKQEGGLGLRRLKEVNTVSCLKLVWRILSSDSLWVSWVKMYLIRKNSFWMIKENTQTGSWMWKKILKCRELASKMYKVEIRNGKRTSFWCERWSSLGVLIEVLGNGSHIDMGIPVNATVEDSWKHRRRNHRVVILNRVQEEIDKMRSKRTGDEDISMWANGKGQYKKRFSSSEIWNIVREKHIPYHWSEFVWFKDATPKYSFILWVAMKGRLAMGDQMKVGKGDINVSCVLCKEPLETLQHLFFDCEYSAYIWKGLMQGLLKEKFSTHWGVIQRNMKDLAGEKVTVFLFKYMFQATVYMIWRERNRRRHGEAEAPAALLMKLLDKNMRNKLTLIQRRGDSEIGKGMQLWFATRLIFLKFYFIWRSHYREDR